jgi:hypothetical protein
MNSWKSVKRLITWRPPRNTMQPLPTEKQESPLDLTLEEVANQANWWMPIVESDTILAIPQRWRIRLDDGWRWIHQLLKTCRHYWKPRATLIEHIACVTLYFDTTYSISFWCGFKSEIVFDMSTITFMKTITSNIGQNNMILNKQFSWLEN